MSSGRVKQICQNFLLHSDSGLAHRLQEEEFAVHFDRNRTHRRENRLGVSAARNVEEEEKQALISKQFEFYQQKQKLEENDIALARQLQEEFEIQSNSNQRSSTNTHYHSHDKKDYYEDIDESFTFEDTSGDEHLARILQEEERLLSAAAAHRAHYKSTFV
ncbi:unnamed protein product [Adineta steineri]|uniref:Coiled-coil domain-containing protein n=1 Tax=Adineta steineri TaxID=433720 RepID=A0A813MB10_9BILA|nr:unnamed protein product [Adineta steineri]CAF0720246.1 unnamed protein product [Adineta steineri]CAF0745412.1 unnamed protein product [Adineta steineri]CAF3496896.1 unnamed protein product [Adineta steineri]CAF3564231.1 unnamed protein product [Adineta steineri]